MTFYSDIHIVNYYIPNFKRPITSHYSYHVTVQYPTAFKNIQSGTSFQKADVDRMVGCSFYSSPPVKNTHLVFITFSFHFLSKTCGFLETIFEQRCFISILTRPYLSNVLHQLFEKLMLTGCRLVDCFLGSQLNFFQALIKLIASQRLGQ